MPRKTQARDAALDALERASMRPRPDAAENPHEGQPMPLLPLASMRPRPDAAENSPFGATGIVPSALASMRPRPDAAEN